MPINAINVTVTVNPINVPCPPPGGAFAVQVVVTGVAAGVGGRYDLGVYDQDPLWWDDTLEWKPMNVVVPGNFRDVHNFLLHCDRNCEVVGTAGSSGESVAEVYAWANAGRNITAMSGVHILRCTNSPPREPEQGTPEQRPQGKVEV